MAAESKPTSATLIPPVRIGWFDRVLIGLAPGWGLRRVRARAAANMIARHYDAAADGRRTSGWSHRQTDATAAIVPALSRLRDLSRDLRRNNGWAKRGVQAIVNNTVGWGIRPKAIVSAAARPALREDAAAIWRSWADSATCDHDGRMSFYGLQALAMESIVESGEVLIVREMANTADGLSVPIRVRVLEADHLDTLKDEPVGATGAQIHNGIELDGRGRRVAYWLFDRHPGASFTAATTSIQSKRVPAEDVIHVYRVERPGMLRGAPWLAGAIARLNDFDDYEDAVLMQQKIAACFGAFVSDMDGASTALGEQSTKDERLETLEPGHIAYLPPGKTVTFATPPNVANQEIFSASNLRRIAASLGVTYEDLTGDYSKVNFSSARMARIAHWGNVWDWQENMLIPQLCAGVWRWVMQEAARINGWPETPTAEWAAPPMPMLEPDKEGLAYARLIRSGVMTLNQAIRERGGDPDDHLREFAEINAKLDDLGIVLDSDPRKTSGAGLTQARPPGTVNPDTGAPVENAADLKTIVSEAIEIEVARQMAEIEQAAARH